MSSCKEQELAQRVIERFPKMVKGRAVLNVETLQQADAFMTGTVILIDDGFSAFSGG